MKTKVSLGYFVTDCGLGISKIRNYYFLKSEKLPRLLLSPLRAEGLLVLIPNIILIYIDNLCFQRSFDFTMHHRSLYYPFNCIPQSFFQDIKKYKSVLW